MAHQLQGGLLLGDLDVLHKLPFGLVARNLHDGDGRDSRQVHIRCAAAPRRVGLHQVALLDQPALLFARRTKIKNFFGNSSFVVKSFEKEVQCMKLP